MNTGPSHTHASYYRRSIFLLTLTLLSGAATADAQSVSTVSRTDRSGGSTTSGGDRNDGNNGRGQNGQNGGNNGRGQNGQNGGNNGRDQNGNDRDRAEQERAQREREKARAEQAEKERAAKERAEREAKARADQAARERAEREAKARADQARERAEREAKARADQAARERAEREAKARADQAARERAEREAQARADQAAKERAARAARERAEQAARARAEREAKEREEEEDEADEKPDWTDLAIGRVSASGNGCPTGTWKAQIDATGRGFDVQFTNLAAEITTAQKESAVRCRLTIAVPSKTGNMSYRVGKFSYSGYTYLEPGVQAEFVTDYAFAGDPSSALKVRTELAGPMDKEYTVTDDVANEALWSPCSTANTFNVDLSVRLSNGEARADGVIEVGGATGLAFELRACD